MRDKLLNETLFLSLAHARVEIAAWVEDYNRKRPHSALAYETPAPFAAELDKQWPASLRPTAPLRCPLLLPRSCTKQPPGSNPSWRQAGGQVSSKSEADHIDENSG